MLHLLTAGCGTTRLYPDVRNHGEYWSISGPWWELHRIEIAGLASDMPSCCSLF
jgi:hypothetical protein